jgi:hypothetical protein
MNMQGKKNIIDVLNLLMFGALACFILQGCMVSLSQKFVSKYGNEKFDEFTNKGIAVRGHDSRNVLLLFVSDDLENAENKGPYIVGIDKNSTLIKKTDLHLMTDTSNVDTSILNKLALKFMEYHVQKLSVDKKGNVYIGLRSNERPDLIYFSDLKYKTDMYKQWKHIKDNWYESP